MRLPLVQEDVIRKEMILKTVRTNVDGLNLEKLTADLQTVCRYFKLFHSAHSGINKTI